jgi:hypothetical protein
MLNLDEGLLSNAERIAGQQGSSVKNLLVEYLHQLVKEDKKRRFREEALRHYVDRPTESLMVARPVKPKAAEEEP